jgi:hypothetical protein
MSPSLSYPEGQMERKYSAVLLVILVGLCLPSVAFADVGHELMASSSAPLSRGAVFLTALACLLPVIFMVARNRQPQHHSQK